MAGLAFFLAVVGFVAPPIVFVETLPHRQRRVTLAGAMGLVGVVGVSLWCLRRPFESPSRAVIGVLILYALPYVAAAWFVPRRWEQRVALGWLALVVGSALTILLMATRAASRL